MNFQIIKRLAALENVIKNPEAPNMIQIYYDCDKKQYTVCEDYTKENGKGKAIGNHRKIIFLDYYKDYLFTGEFHGTVIIDLFECPDEYAANLYTFKADTLRKEAGIDAGSLFSIEIGKKTGYLTHELFITQYT